MAVVAVVLSMLILIFALFVTFTAVAVGADMVADSIYDVGESWSESSAK